MYIVGRKVTLREIEESDLKTLWVWRNESRFTKFCSVRRDSITIEEFLEEIDEDFSLDRHEQFLIYKNTDSKQAIGTIYSYKFNPEDEHTFVTIHEHTWSKTGTDGQHKEGWHGSGAKTTGNRGHNERKGDSGK